MLSIIPADKFIETVVVNEHKTITSNGNGNGNANNNLIKWKMFKQQSSVCFIPFG